MASWKVSWAGETSSAIVPQTIATHTTQEPPLSESPANGVTETMRRPSMEAPQARPAELVSTRVIHPPRTQGPREVDSKARGTISEDNYDNDALIDRSDSNDIRLKIQSGLIVPRSRPGKSLLPQATDLVELQDSRHGQASPAETIVNVTIGRIEVRATVESGRVSRGPAPNQASSSDLQAFLSRRST
jgi:hypothetical protein